MKIFEKMVYQMLLKFFPLWDRPLGTPTAHERELTEELRVTIRRLSSLMQEAKDEASETKKIWIANVDELLQLLETKDPREFLRWDVIVRNMFVTNGYYLKKELDYLKRHDHWNNRWKNAVKESRIGHPVPFIFYPRSSGNLVHHAYHVAQFEDKTGERITDYDLIFEFGGGYGSLCRLLYQIGFKGKYVMFDFPAFSALQVFYLKLLGFDVALGHPTNSGIHDICCIYDVHHLEEAIINHRDKKENSIFIATWSISETPFKMRRKILDLVASFDAFFIAYQEHFGGIDNRSFFRNWKEEMNPIRWMDLEIDHSLGGDASRKNFYLIGRKEKAKELTSKRS